MAEKVIVDGLVLIRAKIADLTSAVSSAAGYEDYSTKALTFDVNQSRAAVEVRPHGTNPMSRQLGGAVNGTLNITFLRDPGGAVDVEADLQTIFDDDGLITVVIHDDRDALDVAGTITPDASPANPQYAGGALITSITPFGTADGGSAATVLIACNLDRDWKVYRA